MSTGLAEAVTCQRRHIKHECNLRRIRTLTGNDRDKGLRIREESSGYEIKMMNVQSASTTFRATRATEQFASSTG